MTCDEKGTVKLWGLNSKMSIFTFDLYQMAEFLYHLNKFDNSRIDKANDNTLADGEVNYDIFCMEQLKSSSLCFVLGRYASTGNNESHQTILLTIRNDSKSKPLDQCLKNLSKFSYIDKSLEDNNLINSML